jgi:hypothetical protein
MVVLLEESGPGKESVPDLHDRTREFNASTVPELNR